MAFSTHTSTTAPKDGSSSRPRSRSDVGSAAVARARSGAPLDGSAVIQLQRQVGNQAVASLLQVQRFAPNAARPGGSVDWNGPGINFGPPAGGASGGVMKVRDQSGGLLIVKPESSSNSSPAMVKAADRVFSRGRFGLQSPNARFVRRPSAEYDQLWQRMVAVAPGAEQPEFFKIMESAGTTDLRQVMEGGSSNQGDAHAMLSHAMAFARRTDYWALMGRVCVGDLFFYNDDRFTDHSGNFGNIMLNAEGQASSIDAEVQMGKYQDEQQLERVLHGESGAGRLGITLENVETIMTRPTAVFEQLWGCIGANLDKRGGEDAKQAVGLWNGVNGTLVGPARQAFMQGVQQGRQDLRSLLQNDEVLQGLKSDFAIVDRNLQGQMLGAKMDWNALKLMRRYYLNRLGGMSQQDAIADGRKYGRYRLRRDTRATGLKWTAKLF
jgi:hypothetical protein